MPVSHGLIKDVNEVPDFDSALSRAGRTIYRVCRSRKLWKCK